MLPFKLESALCKLGKLPPRFGGAKWLDDIAKLENKKKGGRYGINCVKVGTGQLIELRIYNAHLFMGVTSHHVITVY